MRKGGTRVFKIFGIDIYLHFTWWIILAFLTYTLAKNFFPIYFSSQTTTWYWTISLISSLLLFLSVLFHELSHSIVAKSYNLKVERITLFFFGGIASLPTEDMKPKTEFWMALAGPIFSIALAFILFLINFTTSILSIKAITFYLYRLNLFLGLFNLIPGYPLDGGRVFRSLLHMYYKDLRKATEIATKAGKLFAGLLIATGATTLLISNSGGLWLIILGVFLWFIANVSNQQVILKEILSKIKTSSLIEKDYESINPDEKIEKLTEKYKEKPIEEIIVQKDNKFKGIVKINSIKSIPEKTRKTMTINSIMKPSNKIKHVKEDENGYQILKKIEEQEVNTLPVIKNNQIKGIITKEILMHKLKIEKEYNIQN